MGRQTGLRSECGKEQGRRRDRAHLSSSSKAASLLTYRDSLPPGSAFVGESAQGALARAGRVPITITNQVIAISRTVVMTDNTKVARCRKGCVHAHHPSLLQPPLQNRPSRSGGATCSARTVVAAKRPRPSRLKRSGRISFLQGPSQALEMLGRLESR